jgi:excisionase family DNA binding protein
VNRLLTSVEVAELLRVPVKTLDAWSYKGIGPPFAKIGRHRRYSEGELEAWLRKQTANGARR